MYLSFSICFGSLFALSILHLCTGHYPVGYQIHSNNDLGEWEQLLIKGALRFKVDVHYHEKGGNCASKGFDSECFLLSHDNPNKEYISYNSSDELISFLITDCQALRKGPEELIVSLCFKNAPDKCDDSSEAFSSWLALVDDFYNTLTETPPKGVTFFLDGDAKPEGCLAGRWELWDSVWIQGSSPDEAYNSNEGEYGRFQVLNDREGRMDWYKLAQDDYGKFSNSTSPYHLWEPDSQADFHEYIKIYESGKEHSAGFCFAINIDIAMFNVYTTAVTDWIVDPVAYDRSSAVNVKLVDVDDASHPRIESLYHTEASETFLYTYQQGNEGLFYSTLTVVFPENKKTDHSNFLMRTGEQQVLSLPNSSWLIDSDFIDVVGVSVHMESSTSYVLITTNSGKFCLYSTSPESVELSVVYCDVFLLSNIIYDATFYPCEKQSESLCSLVLSSEDGELKLSVVTMLNNNVSPSVMSVVAAIETVRFDIFSLMGLEVDKLLSPTLSSGRLGVGKDNVFVFVSAHNRVFGTFIPIDESFMSDTSRYHYPWTIIGVGNNIGLSVGNDEALMLVTDFGFCYNSHKHNTRSTEKVCSSIPKASRNVLDYNIGFEKDWTEQLRVQKLGSDISQNVSQVLQSYVTPCHSRILHGSFDQGSRPSLALSSHPSKFYFLELHEGLMKSTLPSGKCGNPLHRGGLILDSFPIYQWIENLR